MLNAGWALLNVCYSGKKDPGLSSCIASQSEGHYWVELNFSFSLLVIVISFHRVQSSWLKNFGGNCNITLEQSVQWSLSADYRLGASTGHCESARKLAVTHPSLWWVGPHCCPSGPCPAQGWLDAVSNRGSGGELMEMAVMVWCSPGGHSGTCLPVLPAAALP